MPSLRIGAGKCRTLDKYNTNRRKMESPVCYERINLSFIRENVRVKTRNEGKAIR